MPRPTTIAGSGMGIAAVGSGAHASREGERYRLVRLVGAVPEIAGTGKSNEARSADGDPLAARGTSADGARMVDARMEAPW